MRLLLDTQLLIWTAALPKKLSPSATTLIEDEANLLMFSVVSIWEVAIKQKLARLDERLHPGRLRRLLLENDYEEVPISGPHAISAGLLPAVHKDPFDRMLVAQSALEGATLLTSDRELIRYSQSIRLV